MPAEFSAKVPSETATCCSEWIAPPLVPAVWRLAWPTILQNVVAGLQGFIDHGMVGRFVGFVGNAAIGVSWQIVVVVIVFVSSVFTGMAVLVSRYVGAGDARTVNRVVYQSFLTAAAMSAILALVGYVSAPWLLTLVNGRRGVPYALTNSASGTPQTVFNFNSIPQAAIDRVEFLKDGAVGRNHRLVTTVFKCTDILWCGHVDSWEKGKCEDSDSITKPAA